MKNFSWRAPSLLVAALVTALGTTSVYAQSALEFSGRAGLGYLATSGNSESDSLNANFDLGWENERWQHTVNGAVIRSSADDVTVAESNSLAGQSKFLLNEADYLFALLQWDQDEFSAYEQQLRETVGYGRRLINNDVHTLSAEVGIGARQSDLRDGTSQSGAILYVGGNYEWVISETAKFTQTLAIEGNDDNTYIETNSALSARVRENLALVLGYTIKNNSDVLPGTEKTDTFTTISLEYSF